MSEDKKENNSNNRNRKRPNNRRRNRRPRNKNNESQGEQKAQGNSQGGQRSTQSSQQGNQGPRKRNNYRSQDSDRRGQQNRRRRSNNRRRRPQRNLTPEEQFLRKYETFRKRHDDSRAEYFSLYHRVNDHKRRQLELKFFKAVEELREFEDGLTEEQNKLLDQYKFHNYKLDNTYSTNHEVSEYSTYDGTIEDSMMLESQRKRESFKEDTEESVGSLEDYKNYKGI